MNYFLFKLSSPRPTFPQDMTEAERQLMQKHGAYWTALAQEGMVVVFGPVIDPRGVWGVGIVEVEDESAARSLADKDPVTISNLGFKWDVFPMPGAILRK
jgi:uncharacterized protein YciI